MKARAKRDLNIQTWRRKMGRSRDRMRAIAREWRKRLDRPQVRLGPWIRFQLNRRYYRITSEEELRASRRSDTVFIFGSGASINDLTEADCRHFERHDTLGFNWFVYQRIVRCDYHLIRGIPDSDLDANIWKPQLQQYFNLIRASPYYKDTVFLVQTGFRAVNGNRAIGLRLLPDTNRVYLWRTLARERDPSPSLELGLSHSHSTLDECVNFAFLLGWKVIVLVGVDLYDRRYFWLEADETRSVDMRRGASFDQEHHRANSGMIENLGRWARMFEERGGKLFVYNPRSLLAATLPVYSSPKVGQS